MEDSERFKDEPLKYLFKNFLYAVWKQLGLPPPTEVQYDIADYLQFGPRRSMVMAFRGVGKSWITDAFAVWLLYRDPDLKIEIVSASKDLADNNSNFIKQIIETTPWLSHMKPRLSQRDSIVQFDVGPSKPSKDPSIKSVGITGQITGTRADVIIADDIEVPRNSASHTMREKLQEQVKEFDAILKPGGRAIYLGTPQTEASLYNELEKRGYAIRVWPARIPDAKYVERYSHRLAPLVIEKFKRSTSTGALLGGSVDPQRFTDTDLDERLLSYGRSGFALQFMLDTNLSDKEKYPLKLQDLMVMDLDTKKAPLTLVHARDVKLELDISSHAMQGDRIYKPVFIDEQYADYTGSCMFIDPSGKGKDETAWAVVKMLHGYLFGTSFGGLQGGYDDTVLESLAKTAKEQDVKLILVEQNFGQGMFAELLKPWLVKVGHPCTIELVNSSKQKELRIIDVLEPVMNGHKLILDRKALENDFKSVEERGAERAHFYTLTYQMTHIYRDKGALPQDDRLDALAGAVEYWVESMAQDADVKKKDYIEELRDKELQKFMDNVLGVGAREEATWCNR